MELILLWGKFGNTSSLYSTFEYIKFHLCFKTFIDVWSKCVCDCTNLLFWKKKSQPAAMSNVEFAMIVVFSVIF